MIKRILFSRWMQKYVVFFKRKGYFFSLWMQKGDFEIKGYFFEDFIKICFFMCKKRSFFQEKWNFFSKDRDIFSSWKGGDNFFILKRIYTPGLQHTLTLQLIGLGLYTDIYWRHWLTVSILGRQSLLMCWCWLLCIPHWHTGESCMNIS